MSFRGLGVKSVVGQRGNDRERGSSADEGMYMDPRNGNYQSKL